MKCKGKLAFDTLDQAERTIEIIHQQRGGSGKLPKRVYLCTTCGKFHLTSMSEEQVGSRASTVADVDFSGVEAANTTDPILARLCPGCERLIENGPGFELLGRQWHRKCRRKALEALPAEQREQIEREWTARGQREGAA